MGDESKTGDTTGSDSNADKGSTVLGGDQNSSDEQTQNSSNSESGTDEKSEPGWLEKLGASKDYAENKAFGSIQDIDTLLKSYIHAQSMIGRDKVVVPGKDDGKEVWDDFYSKIGLPKGEDYKLTLADGHSYEEDEVKKLQELAREHRLMPEAASKFLEAIGGLEKNRDDRFLAEAKEARDKGIRELREEWGGGSDARFGRAARVVSEVGGEELRKYLNESGLGDDPKLIKIFDKIGEKLYQEGGAIDKGQPATGYTTPDEAQRKINEYYADLKGPYFNRAHPDHKRVVEEVKKLTKVIISGKS